METIGQAMQQQGGIERFKGFAKPNTTPTPDDVFDIFLTELTHAELKVLLYIIRRTYGFKKAVDQISLKQITSGLITRKGRQLDYGAGVNRRTAQRVVKRLEDRGLITVKRVRTEDGYNHVNTYSLRFRQG
ncbi:replication protein [Chloroflexota bacterium]